MRGTNPQRCASLAGHDNVGVGGRGTPSPPSASSKLAPPPLEVLLPHSPPRSTRCPSWALVLRGRQIPAPSVRSALGRHDVERWRVGGLCWKTVPPRVAQSVRWRWMVGGLVKMFGGWWGAGRVDVAPRKPAPPVMVCRRDGDDGRGFIGAAGSVLLALPRRFG